MDIGSFNTKDLVSASDHFEEVRDAHSTMFGPAVNASARIRAEHGEVLASALQPGDRIYTRDHGLRPIRRIETVTARRGLDEVITVRPGALGNSGKLVVSPEAGILFSSWRAECLFDCFEVLAPAKGLINDKTILKSREARTPMVQILMDKHEIIFAEDLPVETLHPYIIEDSTAWPVGLTPESFGSLARHRVTAIEARDLAPEA